MAWYNQFFNVRKLFGSTFYSRASTNNYLLGSKTPIWVDEKNLGHLYNFIPEVRLVIDYKASMFANMDIKCLNADGEEVEHEVLGLLENPNPLQTQNEYLAQYMVNKSVYGNAFINKIQATSTSFPSTSYVLPSEFMKICPTGKIFQQSFIEDIIKNYELDMPNGQNEVYLPEDILHKNDVATDDYFASDSRLVSLKYPISNIEGAYKTRNVIINEKGAIGILSNQNKDTDGGLPINAQEREKIQQDYQSNYGIHSGQDRLIISNSNLKWEPMSFPMKDLMVFEEVEEDFYKIIDAFGLNNNIFSNTKGSTFENAKQGLKGVYENTIIPEAEDLMQGLTTFFGLEEQGLVLHADYSHLPIMQEDELNKANTLNVKTTAITSLLERGLIDEDEAKVILDI